MNRFIRLADTRICLEKLVSYHPDDDPLLPQFSIVFKSEGQIFTVSFATLVDRTNALYLLDTTVEGV